MVWRWKDWGPDSYNNEVQAKVIEIEKPKIFSFEWGNRKPTLVTFELEAQFGGTVVTCAEEGYDDSDLDRKSILSCASGWGEAMTLLKFYLEYNIIYTQPKR